jgi:valyl-tRNA synthetase
MYVHSVLLFSDDILSSYQARITNQLHRLGGSYDWDRVAFTMDEVRHSAFN